MMWIGLVIGVLVGAAFDDLEGAVVGGFLGWLAGLIIQSKRTPAAKVAIPNASAPETLEARVARLERTVASLEARIAGGAVVAQPEPEPAPLPEPVAPAPDIVIPVQTGTQTEAEPAPPPPPATPNPIWAWLTGGNTIARVGLLILFFGFAFLLKYAADHQMLPVELRVGGVAIGGIALLVLGWRLREKRPAYALGLQGAGVAVLYLTTFAALRLWHLLPPEAAFFLLALIAAFSAYLAVKQDAMALAVIAAGGGFLAPILASSGGGSHVTLFSYYLLLNLGIAGIAIYKSWRALNLTGFLFTFFIGLAWGMKYYQPAYLGTTEPFLVIFFVLYVAIAILFARSQPPALKGLVDGTLVFGTPLAAFALQAGMVHDIEFALAFSALAMATLYVLLATLLRRAGREGYGLLAQAFLALGVVFATLAIPLALDARWTSASWALEGAAIVWIGTRQERTLARAFGLLLQPIAAFAFFVGYDRLPGSVPLVDAPFIGAVLLAGAGVWIHRLLLGAREHVSKVEVQLTPWILAWGLAWWVIAGYHEIHTFAPYGYRIPALAAFFAGTGLVLGVLARRWTWGAGGVAARLLLPFLFLMATGAVIDSGHAFGKLGWIAWPFALAAHLWILKKVEPETPGRYFGLLHAGGVWLAALLGAHELHWVASRYAAPHTAWSAAALVVVPALLVLLAASRHADHRWPVAGNERAYRLHAPVVLAVCLILWSLIANTEHSGASNPLPYLPILNAIDLAHVLGAIAFVSAWRAARRSGLELPAFLGGRAAVVIAGLVTFLWLNAVLLRTLHHWAGIAYNFDAMSRSVLAQASLSVFWSLLALALMVYSTRHARRALWMVGAGLMAVVVAKLFLVDLSNVGGIERIVSFIAVGVLMLVIGYFSPVPPRKQEVAA